MSTENDFKNNSEQPTVAHLKVPMWIKIMWVLGIIWVIIYIIGGLKHSPTTW